MTLFRTLLFRSPGLGDGPNHTPKPNELDVSQFTPEQCTTLLEEFKASKTTLKSSKDAVDLALSNNDTTSMVSLVKTFEDAQQKYNEFKSQLIQAHRTLIGKNNDYFILESQLTIAKDTLAQGLKISPTNGSQTFGELAQAYEDIGKKYSELSASFEQQQITKKIFGAILDTEIPLPEDATNISFKNNGGYEYKSQGMLHLHRPDDTEIPLPNDATNIGFSDTHISFNSAINGTQKYYRSTLSKYEELFGPEKETISAQDITATGSEKIADILQQTGPKDIETPKS